jgi:hypothetical protein
MAMTTRDHNNLLGTLIMVRGGLLILIGLIMAIFMAGGGMLMMNAGHRHDDHIAGGFMMAGGVVGGFFLILAGFFDLYTGSRIRMVAPVGRTLGIVASILMLLSFPLGTALGAYGLWFLFSDDGRALYTGSEVAPINYDPPSAPPPNSWA